MPTFKENLKLGTKTPLIQTDDLSDGAVTADKISKDIVDGIAEKVYSGIYDEIELKDIDLENNISDYLFDKKVMRLKVIEKQDDEKTVVGLLEILSDPMRHQLTEIFKTSLIPATTSGGHPFGGDDFEKFTGTFAEGKIYTYYRFYNYNMGELANDFFHRWVWSNWRIGADSWTREYLDYLSGLVSKVSDSVETIKKTYVKIVDAMTNEDIDEIIKNNDNIKTVKL